MINKSYIKNVLKDLGPIIYRNVVTLVNLIVGTVVVLLFVFREFRDGLFIASVLVLNMLIGIFQEIRARIALEKLQALMVQKVTRIISENQDEIISINEIGTGDKLKLKLGDQIPADGVVYETMGFEVNESLLTGESDNIFKEKGDKLFSGSIVVAGNAIITVTTVPDKSFVTEMTKKIKRYSISQSQIQKSIGLFIKYMSYLLLAVVVFVVIRGLIINHSIIDVIKEIAAISTTLVPEGLILATTLLFAYGAVQLFKEKVLLQEINATEGLGRVKNLCVDKTGTLTENKPKVEQIIAYDKIDLNEIENSTIAYIKSADDKSETAQSIKSYIKSEFYGKVLKTLPFSSSRKYGAAYIEENGISCTITLGAPDILSNFIYDPHQKNWIQNHIEDFAPKAKRLVLVCKCPEPFDKNSLEGCELNILALFVLSNPLRPGTKEIINFFQNRGVHVRVISGDNPKTVQAIAEEAGIENPQLVISGNEIENWNDDDFQAKVGDYHAFARIKPEQKEKIVSALRKDGFTAMVGDGANDALAIKRSDLGIAMFDGAQATRQIAQVVLMNNSFAALPKGITLADNIISTLELVASIFFNRVSAGLMLFIILSFFGQSYPISPRNMTVINYFTIGLPILYWAVFPARGIRSLKEPSMLRKILPFSIVNGLLTSIAGLIIYFITPKYLQILGSNVLVVIVWIGLGYWFFTQIPYAYSISVTKKQNYILFGSAVIIIVILFMLFNVPFLSHFFGLKKPGLIELLYATGIIIIFGGLQYFIIRKKIPIKIFQLFNRKK
jgi:cation-transporting ATPase E